ncbi:MAG: GNAT family N-acetyltransferase [Alphaproteobacteria bacterium]|uniref:GNAT family N-acetyltransferase n=1 Tax=Rhizobium/Agrobacterium group TaxID=227290 RepID=UPI00129B0F4F|nr:GNAT family N-acetyltransferase [Agrobacterium sp. MA01]MBU0736585.1 GNAT family N-acetyltransferase [Alphaproteobacteria bacterium]MBU0835595.1 GNAT family N-acetyltransferase [Alphaproteobacteria bacterium]MBU1764949.1 GNAT family N-acetyltransferase [Alphaproteobacteria bacterium]QGG92757.1 GNAT family N-acetyltransferase [Agrobacterium sp. MA01]
MSIVIRQIDPSYSQYEELLALIMASFAYMDGVIDPPSSAHRLTIASLTDKARDEIALIAEMDANLAGCAFLRPEPDFLYLGKLAVAAEAQGKGIGGRLLAEGEAIAQRLGKQALRLETRIELTGNHDRFGAWGFIRTAERSHAGYDRPTYIEMQKRLT